MKVTKNTLVDLLATETKLSHCGLCGLDDFERLANNDRHLLGIQTVACQHCGLIQTNPRPTTDFLNLFYDKFYREFYSGSNTPQPGTPLFFSKIARLAATAEFVADAIRGKEMATIIDYGCSEGLFFGELIKRGIRARFVGIEKNRSYADYAKLNFNATVYDELVDYSGTADLVIVNHVLEHVLEPSKLLDELAFRLNREGIIYIDVPDAESYKDISSLHIAHLYHFTQSTLLALLKKSGFTVIQCEKHNPPFHPISLRALAIWQGGKTNAFQPEKMANSDRHAMKILKRINRYAFVWKLKVLAVKLWRNAQRMLNRDVK